MTMRSPYGGRSLVPRVARKAKGKRSIDLQRCPSGHVEFSHPYVNPLLKVCSNRPRLAPLVRATSFNLRRNDPGTAIKSEEENTREKAKEKERKKSTPTEYVPRRWALGKECYRSRCILRPDNNTVASR
ncbi:hypothetical protein PUN28_014282 [Cardiocondyla obscurior]|uniref:Uncharacterized protein n=1 Tax=Cardiocondyla obscurior TaxID=286306 RepID=A0AAW2F580_9HYME